MKKIAAISLIFIYSLSVVGLAVNKFYCCGKLESVSLSAVSNSFQTNKQTKTDGCCKNEKQSFKVKDSHVSSGKVELNTKNFALVPSAFFSSELLISASVTNQLTYHIKAPAVYSDTPAYIFNSTFRI